MTDLSLAERRDALMSMLVWHFYQTYLDPSIVFSIRKMALIETKAVQSLEPLGE
jgi:hypothetical protein